MKLLFYVLMLGFIVFLNIGLFLPFLFSVDEDDIGKNISDLKKHQWFQNLLSNEQYRELIIHDNSVRKTIGKFNNDKLDKKFFKTKYQKKLQNLLQQKTNQLV